MFSFIPVFDFLPKHTQFYLEKQNFSYTITYFTIRQLIFNLEFEATVPSEPLRWADKYSEKITRYVAIYLPVGGIFLFGTIMFGISILYVFLAYGSIQTEKLLALNVYMLVFHLYLPLLCATKYYASLDFELIFYFKLTLERSYIARMDLWKTFRVNGRCNMYFG